ncbi:AAA family ATPase [Paenibacillus filicis]|uniref:Nuclease SbcCD subunit C n=1 Tax=Paenibacillus filicis TaxID=669464 RepID=A0ABU9DPN7_9BACL
MPNWIEEIRRSGLTFVNKHRYGETLELYETLHSWQGIKLGKYLILPTSPELFSTITESADSFSRFEDEIISPFYFRLKGDWSWNLYVVFVVSDMTGLPAARLSLIQRGKRFGKKTVISFDQLSEKLPMAKVPGSLGGAGAGNPLQDWQGQLAEEGLLFCLDNFRSQPVKNYVETGALSGSLPQEPSAATIPALRPVGPIGALDFGSRFRPHVLAGVAPFQFAQVNLLAGPNGMGKTSVLEAIELAFTGSVQRNLLADRQAEESWDGSVLFKSEGEAPFHGTPNPEEKKQRETAYYKHKVGPRANSHLNSAFHQYNYFSSEAVHQFCFGPAGKLDYRAAFARVIFGEQLERYEQCWKQHLEEFQKLSRKLQDEHGELSGELTQKYSEGVQDSELLKARAHAHVQQMDKWMKHCLFTYPIPEKSSGLTDIRTWLDHLKPLLHELDVASTPLSGNKLPGIQTSDQLDKEEQAGQATLDILQVQLLDLKNQLGQLPSSSHLEHQVQQRWNSLNNLRTELEDLQRIIQRLAELAPLINQPDSRLARLQLDEQIRSLESAVHGLSDVDNLYGQLTFPPLSGMDINQVQASLNDLDISRSQTQEALDQATEQAALLKDKTGRLQKLQSELKATARMSLHLHPNQTACPLCGHDHETTQFLRQAIDSSLQTDGNELAGLLTDIEQYKLRLLSMDADAEQLRLELTRMNQLAEARTYLLSRSDVEESRELAGDSGLQAVQHVVVRICERINRYTSSLQDLRGKAQALDERGITIASITELRTLLEDSLLARSIRPDQTELPWIQLELLIKQESERVTEKTEAARIDYAAIQEIAKRTDSKRQTLSQQLDELTLQEQQLTHRMLDIAELRQACSRLAELHVRLPGELSWSEWRLYFQKLMLASEELGRALEPLVLVERLAYEIAGLRRKLEETTVKRDRCNRAVEVLSSLRSLTGYGDDFVRSNFEAISRLFVALHSPNEFEGLEWNEDKIVARRKGSGARCAIYQLSTGQRTSVLLAIFFIMHLVMESAPRFLLLDEPVANMDELNVLGLLDFLRQLTITQGTQIFFTTANPQIATLFRRKFSFLEDDFRVFHLRRDVEGPLRVHIQQFKPHLEKPIALTY